MALFFTKSASPGTVFRLKSFTRDDWYDVDTAARTCSCPAFRNGGDDRGSCKHLTALGVFLVKPSTPKVYPTFSQAISGLVKSLRVRRVEDAVYWLVYLTGPKFPEYSERFRVARRLLIGTAEDGHAIPPMERCVDNLSMLTKLDTPLIRYVAEAVRICKLPCWWHPDSGGHDYIYQNLVGERRIKYLHWEHKDAVLREMLVQYLDSGDKAMALGCCLAWDDCRDAPHHTKQAEFLHDLAVARGHTQAARVSGVHLSAKSALASDNNFICMAAWMLAGGVSPCADAVEPVTTGECVELIELAQARWQKPKPIPGWCCDGIHCAGSDTRFAGMFTSMMTVINAYHHYGRVDPADSWLPEFTCYDGLVLEAKGGQK